jgi:hypothetical protein
MTDKIESSYGGTYMVKVRGQVFEIFLNESTEGGTPVEFY